VTQTGLADKTFLALTAENWIDLGVSALIVLIGSLLVIPLLFGLLRWVVRRTKTRFDDDFLASIGRELRWLVVVILTELAVLRLEFLSDWLRLFLDDLFFLLGLGVLTIIAFRLITFTADRYLARLELEAERQRWGTIMNTLKRLGYFFVSLIVLSVASNHFGIDVTLPSVILIFIAVIIVIAARATIADAVGGFVILIIQPFRVGDDILIKDLNTWGNVVEIGILNTSLHTLDNRLVIVPNSQIAQSQVVNYTFPNPSFRVHTDIVLAYGTDFNLMRQVIEKTVRGVEGVLPDKPVDVFFLAFGDSARQVRVQWWIETVNHQNRMLDRVNEALERALDEASIDMPNPTFNFNLKRDIPK
jgi:small-conductance mechanosensitive channel